jgi:asparagine N-glycosylation enzyme membrane subunit Stt3
VIARASVVCAVLLSFWLRVSPAWTRVFTPWGVDFQEPDAWFHLRTVHNLLAHFPFRSGFDPYALFPAGMNLPTGPLWDFMIASTAWVVGLGRPSADLTDHVAAWLPAVLGALCPIPIFLVSRRLFGLTAALFAALWIAVTPGEFMWLSHLGHADHHAAEGLFSLLVFCFLYAALEARAAVSRWMALLAGVSLGALLATQPAAIFVPGILAFATVLAPRMALPVVYALAAAAVTLLPVAKGLYTTYDWLSIAVSAGAAGAMWLLELLHTRKGWPAWSRWIAIPASIALALGATQIARPALLPSVVSEVGFLAGSQSDVAELQPVVGSLRTALRDMNDHLGTIWVPALPALIWIIVFAFRKRRPSLILLAVYSLAFTIAAFLRLRMILYYVPFAAILAGAVCAWLARFATVPRYRVALAAGLAALLLGFNVPAAASRMATDGGGGRDWLQAMAWLRFHSPEPFADSDVWGRYFPRLGPGQAYPASPPAWGVAVWWDKGYMLENLAHRLPMANGSGAGTTQEEARQRIGEMASFYASTFPEAALHILRRSGARYVIADPSLPVIPAMAARSVLPFIQKAAGYDSDNSFRIYWHDAGGFRKPMYVYFADYYHAMGVRLFLNDGKAVRGTGPWVFRIQTDTVKHEVLTGALHFDSEREAGNYMAAHHTENLIVGCTEPLDSCFDVEPVRGLRRVFSSDPAPLSLKRDIETVKIFELEPVR